MFGIPHGLSSGERWVFVGRNWCLSLGGFVPPFIGTAFQPGFGKFLISVAFLCGGRSTFPEGSRASRHAEGAGVPPYRRPRWRPWTWERTPDLVLKRWFKSVLGKIQGRLCMVMYISWQPCGNTTTCPGCSRPPTPYSSPESKGRGRTALAPCRGLVRGNPRL